MPRRAMHNWRVRRTNGARRGSTLKKEETAKGLLVAQNTVGLLQEGYFKEGGSQEG